MQKFISQLQKPVSIAPLAMFRVIFGLMLFISTLRFILKGWVYDLYVEPSYYFTYYGFDWVKPLGEVGMYIVFALLLISSIGILLGYFYKFSAALFFILFTYVELIDKTNYLNHYYFVSLVSFLLIIVPAGRYFSLDTRYRRLKSYTHTPKWTIDIIKFQLGVVYFFAGVAKLNYHWLIEAQPLANWLKHQTDLAIVGPFMKYKATAYLFAWAGALYDLSIPFILLSHRFRLLGYTAVVVFHILTAMMFPIGVFPLVMIGSTLIFFSAEYHQKCIDFISKPFSPDIKVEQKQVFRNTHSKFLTTFLVLYVCAQLLLPFRYVLYPGNLFWTEQGFRFSWRVMLIEKVGYAEFKITDSSQPGHIIVDNAQYLTPQQEKMMATQPDMILQYAHFLKNTYMHSQIITDSMSFTMIDPVVTVNSSVVLFNEGSRPLVLPHINLAKEERGWHHKKWIENYD
jgi:hypothetical protein